MVDVKKRGRGNRCENRSANWNFFRARTYMKRKRETIVVFCQVVVLSLGINCSSFLAYLIHKTSSLVALVLSG